MIPITFEQKAFCEEILALYWIFGRNHSIWIKFHYLKKVATMAEDTQGGSRFASFIANIETKITNLVTLEIKTIVGDLKFEGNDKITPKKDGDFLMMHTKIDLIQGDMVSYLSTDLMQDRYAWLREFHARKEEKGHEIIQGNIKALFSLFDLYRSTKRLDFKEHQIDETSANPYGSSPYAATPIAAPLGQPFAQPLPAPTSGAVASDGWSSTIDTAAHDDSSWSAGAAAPASDAHDPFASDAFSQPAK